MQKHDGPDDRSEALKLFKDWNDKLLVTSVAALAWVVGDSLPGICSFKFWSAASLALSIGFGIISLGLLPLIQEQGKGQSIYQVRPKSWFTARTGLNGPRLTNVCMPHHLLFYLGVLLYLCEAIRM